MDDAVRDGGVVLAVSFDIANAFNSLPWPIIRRALVEKEIPGCLRRVLDGYLSEGDRWLSYIDRDDRYMKFSMRCGIPQGSVLGPTLWNIGYDSILRIGLPVRCSSICYADDTFLVVRGSSFREAVVRAELGAIVVVRAIERLGLKVSIKKTEAVAFACEVPRASLRIGDIEIEVKSSIKYLGLVLDSRWTFREHFQRLFPKALGTAVSLGRLTANIGGPGECRRRVYATVVMSVVLYGAPVWTQAIAIDRITRPAAARLQRQLALRIIRGTVSYEASLLLARLVPFDLLADRLRSSYLRRRVLIERDGFVAPRAMSHIRDDELRRSIARWRKRLEELPRDAPGAAVRGALVLKISAWMTRAHGGLTYRITQVIVGHGCFEAYLHKIRKSESPICRHCRAAIDNDVHTFLHCPSWAAERRNLFVALGLDLDLDQEYARVIEAIMGSSVAWTAFARFFKAVMRVKQEAEKDCERDRRARVVHPPVLSSFSRDPDFS